MPRLRFSSILDADTTAIKPDAVSGVGSAALGSDFQVCRVILTEGVDNVSTDLGLVRLEVFPGQTSDPGIAHLLQQTGTGDALVQTGDSFAIEHIRFDKALFAARTGILQAASLLAFGKKGIQGQPGRVHVQFKTAENQFALAQIDNEIGRRFADQGLHQIRRRMWSIEMVLPQMVAHGYERDADQMNPGKSAFLPEWLALFIPQFDHGRDRRGGKKKSRELSNSGETRTWKMRSCCLP